MGREDISLPIFIFAANLGMIYLTIDFKPLTLTSRRWLVNRKYMLTDSEKPTIQNSINHKKTPKIPLRSMLVIPFVVQVFAAVGLTGYLSLRNGQKAVNDLASQLRNEVSERINLHLDNYMTLPHMVVQNNGNLIDQGFLKMEDTEKLGHFFWQQLQAFKIPYILYGFDSGNLASAGYNYEGDLITIDEVNQEKNGNAHLLN